MCLPNVSCALLFANLLLGQPAEHPITSLPYTPSLDIPSMDRSVDPCVNFYMYSCGGWIKRNPIPADQPRWNVYAKLAQDNQMFLWGILEDAAEVPGARAKNVRAAGRQFRRCAGEYEDSDGDRDCAGKGVADARGQARSLQAVPQDDAQAARSLESVLRLGALLERCRPFLG